MNKLLLTIIMALNFTNAFPQSLTYSISPGSTDDPICPGVSKLYKLQISEGNLPACTYTWTATNGYFPDNNNSATYVGPNLISVNVKWVDNTNDHELKVEVSNCPNNSPSGELASNTYAVATFTGQSFPQVGSEDTGGHINYGPVNIPYCDTPIIQLYVDHMYVKHTGGVGEPPLLEAIYSFGLPSGWKQYQTNLTGTIISTVNSISITPVSGATAICLNGSVGVQGVIPASYSCGGTSQIANIQLNRTGSLSMTAPPGYSGPSCGNVTPITFSVASFSCSPSYSWSFPTGWSGSSTSNSITLTPSGTTSDVGTISVTVFGACTSSKLTAHYTTPSFIQPAISGPGIICTTGNYAINNIANQSISWSSDTPSGLSINASTGSANQINNFNGLATVTANTSGSCGSLQFSMPLWVGTPADVMVLGPQTVTAGSTNNFEASPISQSTPSFANQQISDFEWSFPLTSTNAGWFCSSSCTNQLSSITAGSLSTFVGLRSHNTCGFSGITYHETFIPQDGCPPGGCEEPFNIFPNPASSMLNIKLKNPIGGGNGKVITPEKPLESKLYDANGNQVSMSIRGSDSGNIISVDGVKNGLYILIINENGKYHKRLVVVKH